MKYRVKFELFGKRMQTVIEAKSEEEAKYLILGKVKFWKIEKDGDVVDDILNLFNMKR